MTPFSGARLPPVPPGIVVRDARPADNDALVALERETPLRAGEEEIVFDRAPDFFAAHRLQPECRVVVGELDGRLAGVMAAALHAVRVGGEPKRVAYIHHARIHPSAQRRGVAGGMGSTLITWALERGAAAPCWLIGEGNAPSLAFAGRPETRWPLAAVFRDFEVAGAHRDVSTPVPPARWSEAVALVNSTHEREEWFWPLTVDALADRLARDGRYGPSNLRGLYHRGRLVAVAGLWNLGASLAIVRRNRVTGAVRRRTEAVALDWGYAPGHEDAFAELLRSLAARAREWGRDTLTICDPGSAPEAGLPSITWSLNLFTPGIPSPAADAVAGLFIDLAYL
ncbi:MAG TPA: GNAT family N-acetyltransferase [Dehalococcoidia bacterium]|nr:GNAT family N-acetyltransferase [Dehalococcoidia bacterium]